MQYKMFLLFGLHFFFIRTKPNSYFFKIILLLCYLLLLLLMLLYCTDFLYILLLKSGQSYSHYEYEYTKPYLDRQIERDRLTFINKYHATRIYNIMIYTMNYKTFIVSIFLVCLSPIIEYTLL